MLNVFFNPYVIAVYLLLFGGSFAWAYLAMLTGGKRKK